MSDEDPISRRAAEIRAEREAAARSADGHDKIVREERLRLAQRFIDSLSERTAHSAYCMEAGTEPYGLTAEFAFLKKDEVWSQPMFDFGIDSASVVQPSTFTYYLEPASAAFAIPNPRTGVARPLRDADEQAVIEYAIVISIEMMARVLASGNILGSPRELRALLDKKKASAVEASQLAQRKRKDAAWDGCTRGFVLFFGIVFAIAFIGNLMRACHAA